MKVQGNHIFDVACWRIFTQQVYAGLYPVATEEFEALNEAILKLTLNDASVSVAVRILRCSHLFFCIFILSRESVQRHGCAVFESTLMLGLRNPVSAFPSHLFFATHLLEQVLPVKVDVNMNNASVLVEHERRATM